MKHQFSVSVHAADGQTRPLAIAVRKRPKPAVVRRVPFHRKVNRRS